jgi:hypothetical protein
MLFNRRKATVNDRLEAARKGNNGSNVVAGGPNTDNLDSNGNALPGILRSIYQ